MPGSGGGVNAFSLDGTVAWAEDALMLERVYIETTIVNYLTARPSRDVVIAGHQQVTREWWDTRRFDYELCISVLVLDESGAGDSQAAQDRLRVLRPLLILETSPEALDLARTGFTTP